ncbi:MAG: hypothetical protein R3F59_35230 [Myxococcota bacterium]
MTPVPTRPPDNPFASPAGRVPLDRAALERALWLLARRFVRLGISPLFVALWAVLVLGLREPWAVAGVWAVGVAMWLPTTLLQARIVFFPSPPDPWLTHLDGPTSDRDCRLWWRSAVADDLLGTAMPLWLVLWIVASSPDLAPWLRTALIVAPLGLFALLVGRRLVALATQEAALDLLAGDAPRALRRLERLATLPGLGSRDAVAFHLARARFRAGDLDGALTALEWIRQRRAWSVDALRVQMTIGRDGPAAARALAEVLRLDRRRAALGVAITALAALHEGEVDEVVALGGEIGALPPGEARRFAVLLLAAALAPTDPGRARAALAQEGWDPGQALAAARAWPPVGDRLARVAEQAPLV